MFYDTTNIIEVDGGIVMKPLKNKYSITLDPEVAEKIKDMAEKDDRNFSQYINMILKYWIASQNKEKDF